MGVGIGVDRDRIGLGGRECRGVVGELRILASDRIEEGTAGFLAAGHDTDDLKAVHLVVGLGMRGAHVAAADDEDPDGM